MRTASLASLATVLAVAGSGPARADTLAVMPPKLLDAFRATPDADTDQARHLATIGEALAADLTGVAGYDATVLVKPEAVTDACPRETAPCLVDVAREAGADRALFVVVQKSSALIFQVFVYLLDLRDEALLVSRDLTFRDDSDESWAKMERFLVHTIAEAVPPAGP